MTNDTDVRAALFRAHRLQGVTLEEIARAYGGISRERVRQVICVYEKRYCLPSSTPVAMKVRTGAKVADREEYRIAQKRKKQQQSVCFVPLFCLDAHLVGKFFLQLGDKSVLYGFDGKSKSNPRKRVDGIPYPSMSTPTNIYITDHHKHVTLHVWVLRQYGIKVGENQHCHHRDGDITNNMFENLQVLSNVEHGRITMREQIERGTFASKHRPAGM